ncbi:MAG: glycosyltransferase family A protein [Hyphomicrobiales bacterium]|nr:glycosyltransferase family A protein [Hyphomicrobiales bacterium]
MKVAIVIPAYNAEAWLTDTLKTVVEQTYDAVDIIVINDGSRDQTSQTAAKALENCRFPYRILEQSNKGLGATRNVGWRATDAPWVQFLDADDFLHPRKLEIQAKAAVKAASDIAFVSSPWRQVTEQNGALQPLGPIREARFSARAPAEVLVPKNIMHPGSPLTSRRWLEAVGGFDESLRVGEDTDIHVRIALAGGKVAYAHSDEPLYLWRMHPGPRLGIGKSRYNITELCDLHIGLLEQCCKDGRIASAGLTPEDTDALLSYCSTLGRLLFRYDRAAFRRYFERLRRLSPGFIPKDPWYLHRLSQVIGYENAETIAGGVRQLKRLTGRPIAEW